MQKIAKSKLKCLLKIICFVLFSIFNDFDSEAIYKKTGYQCMISFLYFVNKPLG